MYNDCYEKLLREALETGRNKTDRTGTGTLSLFGPQLRYDLSQGFPLITTKKVFWKGVVIELLWLLRGETNVKFLRDYGVTIWDEWCDSDGNLGPVYGHQWRSWGSSKSGDPGIDQIKAVIDRIKTSPDCRRLIVSAWNVADIPKMKLPPCHCFFQFEVYDGRLNCMLYQRSADLFLGVPFNIASYSLLTHMIAHECGLKPGIFVHNMGDAHIYKNHLDQVREQLSRTPFDPPSLQLNYDQGKMMMFVEEAHKLPWKDDVNKIGISYLVKLNGYLSHNTIKAEVSV